MIYVIQAGEGAVKIGVTNNPAKRIAAFQTASAVPLRLLRLYEGDAATERSLHQSFAGYRLAGEWFSPAVLAEVIDLPQIPLPDKRKAKDLPAMPHPAAIVDLLGGSAVLAAAVGVHRTRAGRWPKEGIPPLRFPAVRAYAHSLGHTEITYDLLFESSAMVGMFADDAERTTQ